MTYKTEKNIAVPAKTKYPFGEMELGDSLSFPREDLAMVRSAAAHINDEGSSRFKVNQNALRCWRIK